MKKFYSSNYGNKDTKEMTNFSNVLKNEYNNYKEENINKEKVTTDFIKIYNNNYNKMNKEIELAKYTFLYNKILSLFKNLDNNKIEQIMSLSNQLTKNDQKIILAKLKVSVTVKNGFRKILNSNKKVLDINKKRK